MSSGVLHALDDRLELHVKGLASCAEDVIRFLISAIEWVNECAWLNNLSEAIVLVLNES